MIRARHTFLASLTLLLASAVLAAPAPKQEIWYHTGYPGGVVGPNSGMSARMGPTKMPVVFEAIVKQKLVPGAQLHTDSATVTGRQTAAPPIDLESLRAAHSDRYLKALFTGQPRELACSQGLSEWNSSIARGWLLNVGGLYAAAETALRKGSITANLGHGYHHAGVNRGEGFCTVNGLAVVAQKLVKEGKARRVMIVDLDQHEGNGSAACLLGQAPIWNVSLYGSNMGGPPASDNNHVLQVAHSALAKGRPRDLNYLTVISSKLPELIRQHNPDLILYQAGMDPYDCSGVTADALAVRDAYVMSLARSMGKPLTWVLAGGYSDLETLKKLHTNTVKAANQVLERVQPGDTVRTGSSTDPYSWSAQNHVVEFPDWGRMLGSAPKVKPPTRLDAAGTQRFVEERNRLRDREKLPDSDLQSAYRALVSGGR
jgi:acetoin utilization deacetylase AcuC-like enzyme